MGVRYYSTDLVMCEDCGEIFDERDVKTISFREWYDVGDQCVYRDCENEYCPYCGSDNLSDYCEDEDDAEADGE